jgi:ribosomal protein S18 acetylase RimI-like enzyme
MNMEITDSPREEDKAFVIAQTRAFNSAFTDKDVRNLCVFERLPDGTIIGGLTGKTYWNYLEVSFLWVSTSNRRSGIATKLMNAAESEAYKRGCRNALLDTFSFQALGFYQRLGYNQFGQLHGFSGKHARHYLHKALSSPGA